MILPNFVAQKRHFFGLSIGKTTLRGIEVNKEHKVVSYAESVYSGEAFAEDTIDKDVFTRALSELVQKGKFSTPYVSVCFPEGYAFSREHTFPIIEDSDIHEAVSWQLRDIFPFSPDEIYFDWKILKKEEKQTTILIIAAQKILLDDVVTVLNKTKLLPISFAPSASVLSPVMPQKEDEIVILVEANHRGSMATIVEHNVSFLTTTAAFPLNAPNQAAQKTVTTVKEILLYYSQKKKFSANKVRILLSGEAASEQMVKTLAQAFQYPVQLLAFPGVPPAYHKSYATAVGKFTKPIDMYSINLLPDSYQELYDLDELYKNYVKSAKLGIGLLVISLCLLLTSLGALLFQGQSLKNEISRLELMLDRAGFNRSSVQKINTQARTITTLFSRKNTPEAELDALLSLVPEGMSITNILFGADKRTFQLSGVAQRREDILDFRDIVSQDVRFKKIEVPLSSLENPENINFSFNIILSNSKK